MCTRQYVNVNFRQIQWPPLLRELVAACWAQDPTLRPAMEEVL
jgi:hypothetical protein